MKTLGMTPAQADDYFRGARDCQDGVPHRSYQSEWYDRGYSTQYEREQVMTEQARRQARPFKIRDYQ
jgi:hypothetical protein